MDKVREYAIITGTYWAFTLTDGALRMLVLLHLYERGYSPLELASLFLLYEFFGVVTNLYGGWLGARVGLKWTLGAGLSFQLAALGMLCVPTAWLSVAYVMSAQALSGIAKDLTKMSSKSYIKLVVPEGDSRGLLKWVALLTGSKNTLKGVGFFLGGFLLGEVGFRGACAGMAVLIAIALLSSLAALPSAPGKAKKRLGIGSALSKSSRLNWLSLSRLFLFGARDVWFVVALPVFLTTELGWDNSAVGAFLALWIIGYGIVQAAAPRLIGLGRSPDGGVLARWSGRLALSLVAMLWAMALGAPTEAVLIPGLALFGVLFAMNSAIHSYLVLDYADPDQVAADVGFYYMANAAGRLLGTILSGAVFGALLGRTGLQACLVVSAVFVLASMLLCVPLVIAEGRQGRGMG